MIPQKEGISILFALVAAFLIYLLQDWGYVSLSEVGMLVGGALLTGISVVLWWGFRERIELRLGDKKQYTETQQHVLQDLDQVHQKDSAAMGEHVRQKDELEKLITPLYLSFDSNRDNPIKGAHLAFEDIKRYGNLAQPELRNLLCQYCEFREENPRLEDRAPSYQWKHQRRLTDTISQISVLVKKRYKELMWEEKES